MCAPAQFLLDKEEAMNNALQRYTMVSSPGQVLLILPVLEMSGTKWPIMWFVSPLSQSTHWAQVRWRTKLLIRELLRFVFPLLVTIAMSVMTSEDYLDITLFAFVIFIVAIVAIAIVLRLFLYIKGII